MKNCFPNHIMKLELKKAELLKTFFLCLLLTLWIVGCSSSKNTASKTSGPKISHRSIEKKIEYKEPSYGKTIDRVIGKVNNDIITLSEIQEMSLSLLQEIRATYSGHEKEVKIKETEKEFLEKLIENKLQLQRAEKRGIYVAEKEIDNAVEDVKKRNSISDEDLKRLLKEEGLSLEDYRERLKEQILMTRVFNAEVRSNVVVTEEETREYYNEHINKFKKPAEVEIRQILFLNDPNMNDDQREEKEAKARDILKKIREGADFTEMARKYSDGPLADKGGYIGRFKKGEMIPAIEKAAFTLNEGEVSDLIKTEQGIHIIKIEKRMFDAVKPLDEVGEEIERALFKEKIKAKYDQWMEGLKKGAVIERFL